MFTAYILNESNPISDSALCEPEILQSNSQINLHVNHMYSKHNISACTVLFGFCLNGISENKSDAYVIRAVS